MRLPAKNALRWSVLIEKIPEWHLYPDCEQTPYADHAIVTRSATLPRPVRTDGAVWRAARDLFLRHARHGPWRLVGVQLANLVDTDWRQPSLLEDPRREMREEKLAAALDGLKVRYGKDAVRRARALASRKGDAVEGIKAP